MGEVGGRGCTGLLSLQPLPCMRRSYLGREGMGARDISMLGL